MKTVDVLTSARDRIADKKNWTTSFRYAKRVGSRAHGVSQLSEANCFCAIGSVGATCGAKSAYAFSNQGKVVEVLQFASESDAKAFDKAAAYLNAAAFQICAKDYEDDYIAYAYELNDDHGHEETLKMFDLAIRNAKRRHINGKRTAEKAVSA